MKEKSKTELRFSGLAPSPEQLEKIMKSTLAGEDSGDASQYEIRTNEFPDGVSGNIAPTLRNEVTQIIYSTHWEHQKRVLDQIESVVSSDRQWAIVRRILMGIMTEQVEKTRLLVGQRIQQEQYRTMEPQDEVDSESDPKDWMIESKEKK
jgi:hypothetical protein